MGARFKLDENLPRDAGVLLRDAGHNVHTVIEERLGGHADSEILGVCLNEGRVLVTLDLDFADIRLYPNGTHSGIWVLRSPSHSIESILALVRGALTVLDTEACENRLWIIEHGRVRIRD